MATSQYLLYLDRKVEFASGTGTFSAGSTTWTLPFTDSTIDCVVPASGSNDGVPLTPTRPTSSTVRVTGDYSAIAVTIGRKYAASFELSQPFCRSREGNVIAPVAVVKRLAIAHRRAGSYTVTCVRPSAMGNVAQSFAPPSGTLVSNFGRYIAWVFGHGEKNRFTISDTSPKPMVISGIDIIHEQSEALH